MSAHLPQTNELHAHIRAREAKEFRLMFIATFPLFLAAGVAARVFSAPGKRRKWKTVFAEARTSANTCIPFAFMR